MRAMTHFRSFGEVEDYLIDMGFERVSGYDKFVWRKGSLGAVVKMRARTFYIKFMECVVE